MWNHVLPQLLEGDSEATGRERLPYLIAFASLLPLVPASLCLSDLKTVSEPILIGQLAHGTDSTLVASVLGSWRSDAAGQRHHHLDIDFGNSKLDRRGRHASPLAGVEPCRRSDQVSLAIGWDADQPRECDRSQQDIKCSRPACSSDGSAGSCFDPGRYPFGHSATG
jgi:hypothetical protein